MGPGDYDDEHDHDDEGVLDGLYSSPAPDDDDESGLDALDDYPVAQESDEDDSGLDDLDTAPAADEEQDDGNDLAAIDAQLGDQDDEEPEIPLIDATSPSGAVTVWVGFSGLAQRIELTPAALKMSEPALADEIAAVADVATKRATSAFQYLTVEILAAQGMNRDEAQSYVSTYLPFASPAEARAAEAELAARDDHHEDHAEH